jgi:hypothetical protein
MVGVSDASRGGAEGVTGPALRVTPGVAEAERLSAVFVGEAAVEVGGGTGLTRVGNRIGAEDGV